MKLRDLLATADEVAELRELTVQLAQERYMARETITALSVQLRTARALVRGYNAENRQLRADMNRLLERQVTE